MNTLDAIQTFIHVAEFSSFTKAAQHLNQPKGSVSMAITQLENHIGTRLLHRTTRRVQMTQDGQMFYERCKTLLAEAEEVETMFQHDPALISGRLRVDMPTAVAKNFVIPRLPEFLQAHPLIELELSSTERFVDLIAEGFDCVLRVATLNDSTLIARPIGQLVLINCASAAYLKTHGTPQTLSDLSTHTIVHYDNVFGAHKATFDYESNNEIQTLKMRAKITVNNGEAYATAALAGFGIIQTPRIAVQNQLDNGTLVEILPNLRAAPKPIAIVYPSRRNVARRVLVFMDWLQKILIEARYMD